MLREVCTRLVRDPQLLASNNNINGSSPTTNEQELYEAVLLRLAKIQSSQDSHAQLTAALASPPDLNLHVPKKPWKPLARTKVYLYVSDGVIRFIGTTYHAYGLFRKSDAVNRPWIGLTANVHERTNFTTGATVNRVTLQIHEDKYSL